MSFRADQLRSVRRVSGDVARNGSERWSSTTPLDFDPTPTSLQRLNPLSQSETTFAASPRYKIARPGFEPGLNDSESLSTVTQRSPKQRVTKRRSRRCTTGCTNAPENERGEVSDDLVSSRVNSLPIKADSFSAALAMIALLPLSDAEKADAVRRLPSPQSLNETRSLFHRRR